MLFALFTLILFFHGLFFLALILKDNSIADIGWGSGFILLALSLWYQHQTHSFPQLVISSLIIIWGLRLSTYIFLRKHGQPEDFRYQKWRITWGKYFVVRSYLQVFMLQMGFLLLISLPLFLVFNSNAAFSLYTLIGSLVALSGFGIEVLSDFQMGQFRKDPKNRGKIIQVGLWNYSRHPNYFGEATFWWGIACIAYPVTNHFLWLISPIVITVLLRYVSGVPMLEKKYQDNPEYKTYAAKTSCMIPWFKRK
jgi:steroid 5-alpha reductase family enzyme